MQCANLGGMEKVALLCMAGLQERGHHCRLLSLNPVGGLGPLLAEKHIPVEGLPYRGKFGWRSSAKMYRAIRSAPADALMMTGHNMAAILALGDSCRDRRLLTLHYHHTGSRPAWQWRTIYRLALRQFPAVTYPTNFIRREAEEIYPPIAAISHTVRYPILVPDPCSEEQRLEARVRLGLPQSARIVGSAGWLIKRKRLDVFLQAARDVVAAVPNALFVVAGDGPLRANLEELARKLEIANRVRWLGWQQDLRSFYLALDILHFNSDWDALGMTPLEALVHGVPVVASVLHGGLCEAVTPNEHIFFTPTHDIDWLADKIVCLLGDPERGRQMASAAREHLAQVCSVEQHVTAVSRLLRLDE
jgi:glycosyltransferase involved in cell wall biosynthesis